MSLTVQIENAERQVLDRRQEIDLRIATLILKIHRQMSAPATLLLAAGIGFIIGELTKRQTCKSGGTTPKTTPLNVALNLLTSARTLYTALPLAWMMKSYLQPDAPAQAPEYQSHRIAASNATKLRRRSKR
jgi:hypothetical protein